MTVNISQIQYIITANDIAKTRFDFPFVIYDKNDIATVLNDDTVPPIFTVTLYNNKNGGYVDFPTPFAVGTVVTLYRKMAYNRKTVFQNNQDVTATALNTEFNNILALAQQNAQHNEKTLRMAASENSGNFVLPRRNDRKNTVLCFDSNGMVQLHKNQYSAVTESENSAQQAKHFETLSKQNYVATQKLKTDILTIVNQQNAQMGLKADKANYIDLNGKINGTDATSVQQKTFRDKIGAGITPEIYTADGTGSCTITGDYTSAEITGVNLPITKAGTYSIVGRISSRIPNFAHVIYAIFTGSTQIAITGYNYRTHSSGDWVSYDVSYTTRLSVGDVLNMRILLTGSGYPKTLAPDVNIQAVRIGE